MKHIVNLMLGCAYELFAISLFPANAILSIFNFLIPFDKLNSDYSNKTPIVIHEHWISKNYWHFFMKRYLEKKGYKVYWTNYSLLLGGADQGASELKNFFKKNDIHGAVLVGISYGALSAYSYLTRFDGWKNVNKFITIAGPFRGTFFAHFLVFFRGGRQILPNSDYLKNLFNDPLQNKNQIFCISAKYDELVSLKSSMLSGANNIIMDVVGHNVLHMFSKAVFRFIANEAKD